MGSSSSSSPPSRRDVLCTIGSAIAAAALTSCSHSSHPSSSAAPDPSGSSAAPPPPPPPSTRPKPGEITLPAGATMPTRKLGHTGATVSILGIGGAHMGSAKTEQEGIRIVREAIDHGVTFLDNCWDYNSGRSQTWMGKALRDGYRDRAFLMTKLDGRSADAATKQLDQSLRALQTDHVDLLQIHEIIRMEDAERFFAPGGAIEAFIAAQRAGKTRFLGFTGHKSPEIHKHMLDTAAAHGFRFDAVQLPLNVMDPHFDSFQKEVLPILVRDEIGVLGMKPLANGVILDAGVVSANECLQYAMSLPTSVVITGCDSIGVLEQALYAALTFKPMSSEQMDALVGRTANIAQQGKFEPYKTTSSLDTTSQHPQWLSTARL